MNDALAWFASFLGVALAAALGWMYVSKQASDLVAYMVCYTLGAILLLVGLGIYSLLGWI